MKRLIKYKIYFQRSLIYLSILSAFINFATFVKVWGIPNWATIGSLILGIFILFVIGFYDHKYVLEKENEILYDKTPQINKLLKMK